ncbi:MAG: hypothetical protein ACYDC8_15440 [Gammaproteobacteria bacterium]
MAINSSLISENKGINQMATGPDTPQKLTVRESHRKSAEELIDSLDGPFRRSALAKVLYKHTNPRSLEGADRLADAILRSMSKDGRIQRHGHQHWIKVLKNRSLLSGRTIPELHAVSELVLTTHCPDKWISIDLETGEAWTGSQNGWRRADSKERSEASACLARMTGS